MAGLRLAGPSVFLRRDLSSSVFDNGFIEKRQLFLRSYQFTRKRSSAARIGDSVLRARRLVWVKLRAVRRFLWLHLRRLFTAGCRRHRRFHRMHTPPPRSRSAAASSIWRLRCCP
ncbi:unnamed protein product [Spirodela intermedia]|uniref:Uncharacterized protein n=1 Tax=Spirodela intermedia TaxID=51605 RepID=A0A7I8KQT9_SPIIN|nr:unnamed protein product [Spirodela intermedia]